jgi:hypothetical protein
VIVFSEASLSRHLRRFADYYHRSRTHLGLQKDTPESRPAQPPDAGRIVAIPRWAGSIIVTNVAPPLEPRTPVEFSPSNKTPVAPIPRSRRFLQRGPRRSRRRRLTTAAPPHVWITAFLSYLAVCVCWIGKPGPPAAECSSIEFPRTTVTFLYDWNSSR